MAEQQPSLIMNLVPLVVIFAIFYLVMILPMRRRQKKHQEMLSKLTRGDRVLTTGGIFGTVVDVEGDVLTLRIADNVRVQVARSAVAGLASEADSVNLGPKE